MDTREGIMGAWEVLFAALDRVLHAKAALIFVIKSF